MIMRLDSELVEREFYPSRAKAVAAIKSGLVLVNGVVAKKASMSVATGDEIVGGALPYVSGRGSLKLQRALDVFCISPDGYFCLDVGASTGGFTEVLLSRGASHVIAVDVGTNQLVSDIRNDSRVVVREQTDIRALPPVSGIDLIVIDVSFISLINIADAVVSWNAPKIIALIKPQFEVPRTIAARTNGVIKSPEIRRSVIDGVLECFAVRGYGLGGEVIESPIRGGSGNIEYLAYFKKL